jgi:hypothetical protein
LLLLLLLLFIPYAREIIGPLWVKESAKGLTLCL